MEKVEWINRRLDSLIARPEMWGDDQAVELQFLLMMEFYVLMTTGSIESANKVKEKYCWFLWDKYKVNYYCCENPEADLIETMREFRKTHEITF